MGFFSRLFGNAKREPTPKYEHPSLGAFYLEKHVGWLNEKASVAGFGDSISIYIAGDADGPSEESLLACDDLLENTTQIWEVIQDGLYELYETYTDEYTPDVSCNSPAGIRETADVISISLRSKHDYEISMTFCWQQPEDDHIVTAYVEDGKDRGHTIDG